MKRSALLGYLCLPALLTLVGLVLNLSREPFGFETLASSLLGVLLFYAAPHAIWIIVAALGRFSGAAWHAGLIGASLALTVIAVLSLFGRDSSGLPIQWLLYWPLALLLQLAAAGGSALYRRLRA